MSQNNNIDIRDLGLMDFDKCLDLQNQLVLQRQQNQIPDTILLVEHPPTITLGARKSENKLLISEQNLADQGIHIHTLKRGGGSTAHNPGQIVIYPIINIKQLNLGVNEYIRTLEQIGIDLLETYDINAQRKKGLPGLWVNDPKIASIGVKVRHWVTSHGMAINISNDLSIFDKIVPCGIKDVIMTSVQQQVHRTIPIDQIKRSLSKICLQNFAF